MDRATRRMLETLSRTADGVFSIDAEHRINYWSKSAEAILGYSAEEVVGRPCYEILHGRDAEGALWCQQDCPVIRRVREGSLFPDYDVLTHRRDGSPIWLNISILCLPGGRGMPVIPVHIFREVTHRKRKELLADRVARLVREASGDGAEAPSFPETPIAPLSPREWEVLTLLARGYNLPRIAETLHIQPVTARNYIQRILHKLGVHSRTEAIAWLYRRHREVAP